MLGAGDLIVYDPKELGVGGGARLWGGEGREKSGALGAVGMGLGRMDTPGTPGREETARRCRRPGLASPGFCVSGLAPSLGLKPSQHRMGLAGPCGLAGPKWL